MTTDERLSDERLAMVYGIPLWAVKASRMPDRTDAQRQRYHDEATRLGVDPNRYIELREANER